MTSSDGTTVKLNNKTYIFVALVAFSMLNIVCGALPLSLTAFQAFAQTRESPLPEPTAIDLKNPVTHVFINDGTKTLYTVTTLEDGSNKISRVDLSTGETNSILEAKCPSTSADGSIFAFYDERESKVALIRQQNNEPFLLLPSNNPDAACPVLSGDGNLLIVDNSPEGGGYSLETLEVAEAARGNLKNILIDSCEDCSFSNDRWLNEADLSHTGTTITFTVISSNQGTGSEGDYDAAKIYLSDSKSNLIEIADAYEQPSAEGGGGASATGEEAAVIFHDPQGVIDGSGSVVVFHSRGQGDAGIYIVTADQGKRLLKGTDENAFSPVINTEGDIIAFWEGNDIVIDKFTDIVGDPDNYDTYRISNAADTNNVDSSGALPRLAIDGGTLVYSEGPTVHILDISSLSG